MMLYHIEYVAEPTDADREAVLAPLRAFNQAQAGEMAYRDIAFLLKDAAGATIGGLSGKIYFNWLFVELLFVPAELRGHDVGSTLLAQAEAIAREAGCVGVWLDTFSFQAPGFYRKLGYEEFGELPDYPRGHRRYFVRKIF